MIKNYTQYKKQYGEYNLTPFFQNEGISFSSSVEPIYFYIVNFVKDVLFRWINKKPNNNYSKKFNLKLDVNFDIFKNVILQLKINLVEKEDDWDVSGTSMYKEGSMFIEIRLYVPSNIDLSENSQFNLMIDQVLRHEINHFYQNYKKNIKGYENKNDMLYYSKNLIKWYNKFNDGSSNIHAGISIKNLKITDLLAASYNMTKSEESSLLSQHSTKMLKKLDSRGEKFIRNILSENNFEEFYNKLINELFEEGYKLEYLDKIPKIISQDILRNIESNKWIHKLRNKDFKSFCKMMFINIQERGNKYVKKVDKIHYLKNLEKFSY